MKSFYQYFYEVFCESTPDHSILPSTCPKWLCFLDNKERNPPNYLSLLRDLYFESVDHDFHLNQVLTADTILQHPREIMFVASDIHCCNRGVLRLFLLEVSEEYASVAMCLYFFCKMNWTVDEINNNNLFIQKLRILSLRRVAGLLTEQDVLSDSTIISTLYTNSFSFFNTLFSLSSFLFTKALDERQSIFIDQCNSINNMTLSQFNGMWLPLGKGMMVHSILIDECRVISTKSRCPCVIKFAVSSRIPSCSSTSVISNQVSLSPALPTPTCSQWISSFLPSAWLSPLPPKSADLKLFPPNDETSHSFYKVIIKTREFIRQEEMASHLINEIRSILDDEGIPNNLRCYDVIGFSDREGIIEYLCGFISFHELRKSIQPYGFDGIGTYFQEVFKTKPKDFHRFRKNFILSLASYSIVCYVLQIKDRNDGNILMDKHGTIVHIDFGFLLSNSPGNIRFETAPFKLTTEMLQLIGLPGTPGFLSFQSFCTTIYEALCKHKYQILSIVQLFAQQYPHLPCFSNDTEKTIASLNQRLSPQKPVNDEVKNLIQQSIGSWTTHWYDEFQFYVTGIL